jgi:hypothetical protein
MGKKEENKEGGKGEREICAVAHPFSFFHAPFLLKMAL